MDLSRLQRRLAWLLLLGAVAAVFAPALQFEFVWDDRGLILENRYLRDWSRLPDNLTGDFFQRSHRHSHIGYWRPVVTLTYMTDLALTGDTPDGFHRTNLLLHLAATAMVGWWVRRLSGDDLTAWITALWFGLHPAHVEAVAWISGRTDLLCAVFVFAALALEARAAGARSRRSLAAAQVSAVLALLSKEMAAMVPAWVGLRPLVLPREGEDRVRWRAAWRRAWPFAAWVLGVAALRVAALRILPGNPEAEGVGRWALFTAWWEGFLHYVLTLIWPVGLPWTRIIPLRETALALPVVAGAVTAAALALLAWHLRRRHPVATYGLGFFLLSMVPLTNFLMPIAAPIGFPFPWWERFLYIPSAGGILCLAYGLVRLSRRWAGAVGVRPAPAAAVAAVLVAAGLGWQSRDHLSIWRSDATLFAAAVRQTPESALAHLNLAVALMNQGRDEEAQRHLREAIHLKPRYAQAWFNLGNLLRERGDLAGAEEAYRNALSLWPDHPKAWMNLGLVLVDTGRIAEAEAAFARAESLLPDAAEPSVNRGNVLRLLGRWEASEAAYRRALRLDPASVEARLGLAAACLLQPESDCEDEGRRLLEALEAEQPDLLPALVTRALWLERRGDPRAGEAWAAVLRRDPSNAAARRRLAAPPDSSGREEPIRPDVP